MVSWDRAACELKTGKQEEEVWKEASKSAMMTRRARQKEGIMTFEIRDTFYLDGEPLQIISGSFHYFRTVPQYWRDRLEKLKNMGCNTVETYIPWNFHEPKRGEYLWDGMRDICRFLDITKELGLYVILRPSPYICAEWEFGGLPAWLLKDPDMQLRCSYGPYLAAVREYYEVLIPKLAPYQISQGGNVILFQIENEYGYYGNDRAYMEFLYDTMRALGITVPFVTSDGPWGKAFENGMVRDALPTGNFGSNVEGQFQVMREKIGENRPLMCMEFWVGWFDAWGEEHHASDLEQNKRDLDAICRLGHCNFYMFEGGTNFGFMNGKNWGAKTADITSYDYDGILTQDGRITPKYRAFREVIGRYHPLPNIPLSSTITQKTYGFFRIGRKVSLLSVLDKISSPIHALNPVTMEKLDQAYGYILYRARTRQEEVVDFIRVDGASDRAQGYLNGRLLFTAFGDTMWEQFDVPEEMKAFGATVDVLVENMGRVNFGQVLEDQRKGLTKGLRINDHRHFGYDIYTLPLDEEQLGKLDFDAGYQEGGAAFYECCVQVDAPADTFLDLTGFGKGVAFVNGFNIGRFWEIGPQKRLYIPAPLLKSGTNTILIFETEGKAAGEIALFDRE